MSTYNPVGDVMDWSLSSMKGGLPSPMQGIASVGNVRPTMTNAAGYQMGSDAEFANFDKGDFDDIGNSNPMSLADAGGLGEGFDWQGAMKGFSTGAQGVLGLANAYNAYRQMKLMEDQFDFAKQDRNQMIANQAAITNANLDAQASARSQLSGNTVGSAGYEKDMANRTQVSGAPI